MGCCGPVLTSVFSLVYCILYYGDFEFWERVCVVNNPWTPPQGQNYGRGFLQRSGFLSQGEASKTKSMVEAAPVIKSKLVKKGNIFSS